jgi:hypothetical protein
MTRPLIALTALCGLAAIATANAHGAVTSESYSAAGPSIHSPSYDDWTGNGIGVIVDGNDDGDRTTDPTSYDLDQTLAPGDVTLSYESSSENFSSWRGQTSSGIPFGSEYGTAWYPAWHIVSPDQKIALKHASLAITSAPDDQLATSEDFTDANGWSYDQLNLGTWGLDYGPNGEDDNASGDDVILGGGESASTLANEIVILGRGTGLLANDFAGTSASDQENLDATTTWIRDNISSMEAQWSYDDGTTVINDSVSAEVVPTPATGVMTAVGLAMVAGLTGRSRKRKV